MTIIDNSIRAVAFRLSQLFLLVLAVSLAGCDGAVVQNTNDVGGTIAGNVYTSTVDLQTGNAGILVYLGGTQFQARTDTDGKYRLDQVPGGTYTMIAEKAGFQSVSMEGLVVDPATHTTTNPLVPAASTLQKIAETTPTQTAPVSATGTILGTVLLEDSPLNSGGVRIEVSNLPYTAVSASDGRFRIMNVEPGIHTLIYIRDGYEPFVSDVINVATGTLTVADVALRMEGATASGSAASTGGAAATTATVVEDMTRAQLTGNRSIAGVVQAFTAENLPITDYSRILVAINGSDIVVPVAADGRFRIENLPPGNYSVLARLDEEEPVLVPADVTAANVTSLQITLQTGTVVVSGNLTGKIILLDPKGEPEEDGGGVQVALNGTNQTAVTDASGAYSFEGLAVGNYTITASKTGYLEGTLQNLAIGEGATQAEDLSLEPDIEYPRVVSTTPVDGTANMTVGLELTAVIRFNKKMNPDTLKAALKISPESNVVIALGRGEHPQADDDKLVLLFSNASASNPIKFNQEYTIDIADTASDVDGIEMREPFSMTFATGAAGVLATSPADGTTGLYLDQLENPVSIFFNTRLNPDSITERNFRVRPDNGSSVRARFINDPNTGWTNVTLYHNWQQNTDYTVTVEREVRAFNKQTLGNTPFTFRFGTGQLEVIQVPIDNAQ